MTFTEQVNTLLANYGELAAKQPEAVQLLNSVYKALFGSYVKKGCGDCNYKAYTAIQKEVYLQQQKPNFNLETMQKFKDRNFVLKEGKVLTIAFTADAVTNANMTDDKAIELLTRYPNFLKHFSKYPGSDTPTKELDLSLLTDLSAASTKNIARASTAVKPAAKVVDMKQQAITDKVNTPPHKRGKELLPMLNGETLQEYADRMDVSLRTVQRKLEELENYDPATKKGLIVEGAAPAAEETNTPAPVVDAEEEAETVEEPKILTDLLTEHGLALLNMNYDLQAILAGIQEIEDPATKEADTVSVAKFFNGELTDADEASEIAGGLTLFLKGAVEIAKQTAAANTEGAEPEKAAAEGTDTPAPVIEEAKVVAMPKEKTPKAPKAPKKGADPKIDTVDTATNESAAAGSAEGEAPKV